ncbi:MAG TPA: CBS domain-containing protein [Acidimicrobiia bacterium]|jgi:CBS domain-containing protein|nr:CBS domain-containing protein [Acidimicrobiia bacterium]
MHTVAEAMTKSVVTVAPDASVTTAARIMRDTGISGLPVVDKHGKVVGILTEADLLHRAVLPDLTALEGRRTRHETPGSTVADLMSRQVVGVHKGDPLAKAARLMEKSRLRRLVVVGDDFTLEGIISRRDVVAALARSDREIEDEIRSGVIDEILGLRPDDFDVVVHEGIVLLAGTVADEREVVRLERLVGSILGVSRVDSKVTAAG